MDLDDGLVADYRSRTVSQLHVEMFDRLVDWSLVHCTCGAGAGYHVKQAYVAATFCVFCVPPHASARHALVSAKCCLLFFLVDDGNVGQLTDVVDFLRMGGEIEDNEPVECLRSLRGELAMLGCETREFESSLLEWATSMLAEQELDLASLTPEVHHQLRRNTIFVSCLILCWLALLHVDLPDSTVAERADILDLATRIVILANDLGSIHADATTDGAGTLVDVNSVLLRHRVLGSRESAVRDAVAVHNSYVAELRGKASDPLLCQDTDLATFVSLVMAVTDGNLKGTRHLVEARYPDSTDLLRDLYFCSVPQQG
jgi:hypothetical protein